jgi:hypothetical protein
VDVERRIDEAFAASGRIWRGSKHIVKPVLDPAIWRDRGCCGYIDFPILVLIPVE